MSKSGIACRKLALNRGLRLQIGITPMPDVIIVYWRDIPAQIIVGKGRAAVNSQLVELLRMLLVRLGRTLLAKVPAAEAGMASPSSAGRFDSGSASPALSRVRFVSLMCRR
jgi:hypothetical protein